MKHPEYSKLNLWSHFSFLGPVEHFQKLDNFCQLSVIIMNSTKYIFKVLLLESKTRFAHIVRLVWQGVWRLMAKVMKNDHFFYPSLTNFMQMQRAAPKDKWLSNTLKCSISYDLHHCQPIWVTYGLTSRLLRSLSCPFGRPSSNQRLVWIIFCTGQDARCIAIGFYALFYL